MKKTRRLELLALLALAVPLFAALPEVPIGTTVPAPAPSSRHDSAAGTDGTDFFVVWTDNRTPGRNAIMGTRVKRSGQVLDPYGIRITSAAGAMSWPTVVWDGAAYVVVWTQALLEGDIVQQDEVWAARVDRDGRIVTAPRLVAEDAMTTSGRYAESNGSVTVIAYRQVSSPGAARVAVLDREGNVVHREALANRSLGYLGISVAATSSRFVVSWSSVDAKLFAIALGSDGRTVRTPREIGAGEDPNVDPVMATDGTTFLILTRRWMPDDNEWVLTGRTVDAELAQIGDVRTLAHDQIIEWVSLLRRGDRYEVIAGHKAVDQSAYGLLSIELDRDGNEVVSSKRGDPLIYTYSAVPQPVAVTNGSDVLVAYTHPAGSSNQIVARVYRGSSPDPDVQELLSWSGNAHARPAIASGPSGHFAAWIENTSVYATRIDANGSSLDGRGVEITKVGFAVHVAFDGTNYVVAWLGDRFIGVRWIAPATRATVAEVHVDTLARPFDGFALAVSPDAAYLAWFDNRIRVTRVSRESRTADLPLAVSPEEMWVENPALAWNGSMLLVAWNEASRDPGPFITHLSIQAARVTSGLSLLDPAPMLVATSGGASFLGAPSIASNGEDWLVVSGLEDRSILARLVLRNGNVEGTEASKIGDGFAPAVAWDGTRYAIAYKSGSSRLQTEHPLLLGAVSATGALLPMGRTPVATQVVSEPSIARTASGEVAIAYTKVSFLPEHTGVERSYFRVMNFPPRGRVVRR